MGRMKELLTIIYGGGDEAVEAAQQIAGLSEVVPEDDGPCWIPVEERLPENFCWVLVARYGGTIVVEAQHIGGGTFMRGNSEVYPTHWMNLPEPPEVKR